ncbi:single-stranded DNA-binding protein WHY1, chloroplastic-like isoform X2 [Tasmannia lanceolata]|uniref:single-stranded DNA-binding protein WHY1, chloroplastic-like isoform X2 n=1 Tax=Tasmannia lanceolata TaxID=3420 RepID=UPI004062F558
MHLLPSPPLQNPNPPSIFARKCFLRTPFFPPNSSRLSFTIPKKSTVKSRRSEYFEQPKFTKPSEDSLPGALPPRLYVGHSIYKGKAALTIEPKAPEFVPLDSGAYKVSKEGFVFLQFAPAVGTRQYDWNRKQVFSLSVSEIGTLMSLGAKDSCEFFHDPFKGKSEEGKIRKILKAEPLPDGTGHFFNLSVQNRLLNVDESIYIPITKGEFAVLISAFNGGEADDCFGLPNQRASLFCCCSSCHTFWVGMLLQTP